MFPSKFFHGWGNRAHFSRPPFLQNKKIAKYVQFLLFFIYTRIKQYNKICPQGGFIMDFLLGIAIIFLGFIALPFAFIVLMIALIVKGAADLIEYLCK